MPLLDDKPALRRWANERRSTLPLGALSSLLCVRLSQTWQFRAAHHVLLYLALPGEINVEGLLALPESAGKRWYAPRCGPAPERRLFVHPYHLGETPLRPGPFGIREPDPDQVSESNPDVLDLAIVPALLLTAQGDRLGYGGGYYDRFLPRLRSNVVRLGLIPESLIVPSLPREPWDEPVSLIVTETRTFHPVPHPSDSLERPCPYPHPPLRLFLALSPPATGRVREAARTLFSGCPTPSLGEAVYEGGVPLGHAKRDPKRRDGRAYRKPLPVRTT